jgi:hypothetical protein
MSSIAQRMAWLRENENKKTKTKNQQDRCRALRSVLLPSYACCALAHCTLRSTKRLPFDFCLTDPYVRSTFMFAFHAPFSGSNPV